MQVRNHESTPWHATKLRDEPIGPSFPEHRTRHVNRNRSWLRHSPSPSGPSTPPPPVGPGAHLRLFDSAGRVSVEFCLFMLNSRSQF